jgi:hypothetical protein
VAGRSRRYARWFRCWCLKSGRIGRDGGQDRRRGAGSGGRGGGQLGRELEGRGGPQDEGGVRVVGAGRCGGVAGPAVRGVAAGGGRPRRCSRPTAAPPRQKLERQKLERDACGHASVRTSTPPRHQIHSPHLVPLAPISARPRHPRTSSRRINACLIRAPSHNRKHSSKRCLSLTGPSALHTHGLPSP